MNRRLALAAVALTIGTAVLTGCSTNDSVMDYEEATVKNPDSIVLFNNVDGHPNLARVCIDGIAFVTTTRKGMASWKRLPEWDTKCATDPKPQATPAR